MNGVYVKIKKYVILKGIKAGNQFFTTNDITRDQTKLVDGTVAYKVVGYADTTEEAQSILFPTKEDEYTAIRDNIIDMGIHCNTEDIDSIMNLIKGADKNDL